MSKIFLVAEFGRPKELLDRWRDELLKGMRLYHDFARSLGADNVYGPYFERPVGLVFPRGVSLEGWTKPTAKGFSRPKKSNKQMLKRMAEIPFPAHPDEMLSRELNLPLSLKTNTGGTMLLAGGFNSFTFCWTAKPDGKLDDMVLVAPEYEYYQRVYANQEITWSPEGSTPVIPEGLRQITEGEVELRFAQSKVDREAYQAADKEIAILCNVDSPSKLASAIEAALTRNGQDLLVEFDAGPTGMAVSASYEGAALKAHPALEKAAIRLAPYLIRCEAEDWTEQTQSSGRIIWRRGADLHLDMSDDDNDWLYERGIDRDGLADMDFEEEDMPEVEIG